MARLSTGKARRQTQWLGSADFSTWTALAASTVILDQALTGAQVASIVPFTVVRMVGQLAVKSDQVAATEEATMGAGAMIVREPARIGGIGNVPTPISEMDDDGWFFYQLGSASADAVGGAPVSVYDFDSHGQRKVEDGDAIVWTVENADAANGLLYSFWFRLLFKVH